MEIHILQVPLHILGRRGGKTGGQAPGKKQGAAAKNICGTKKVCGRRRASAYLNVVYPALSSAEEPPVPLLAAPEALRREKLTPRF